MTCDALVKAILGKNTEGKGKPSLEIFPLLVLVVKCWGFWEGNLAFNFGCLFFRYTWFVYNACGYIAILVIIGGSSQVDNVAGVCC